MTDSKHHDLDDLRTRIAAVLYSRAMSRLAWHRAWDDLQPEVQQMWLDDADAVIRVLEESVNECWEYWPARRCVVLGTVEVDNA